MKIDWTKDEINTQLLENIDEDSELKKVFKTNLNVIGKLRAILESIGRAIYDFLFTIILSVYNNIFVYTADEEALVQHLSDRGMESWKQAEKAVTTVRIGSSTLPDSEKQIPQLSIVSTPGNSTDEIKQFLLLSGGSIDSSTPQDSRGYYTIEIDVASIEAGAKYNVPADSITEFVTEIPGIDIVYNEEASTYGRDKETIDEVRQRIITKNLGIYRGLLSWFVSETMDFSFVTDAVAIPRYSGRGTVGIAFLTTSGQPTQEQMDTISDYFNNDEMDPAGAYEVIIFQMSEYIFTAAITVYWVDSEPSDSELNSAMEAYFNQLTRGEDIIEVQIHATLIVNVNKLKDVDITSHSGFEVDEYEFPILGTITWTKVEYAE